MYRQNYSPYSFSSGKDCYGRQVENYNYQGNQFQNDTFIPIECQSSYSPHYYDNYFPIDYQQYGNNQQLLHKLEQSVRSIESYIEISDTFFQGRVPSKEKFRRMVCQTYVCCGNCPYNERCKKISTLKDFSCYCLFNRCVFTRQSY